MYGKHYWEVVKPNFKALYWQWSIETKEKCQFVMTVSTWHTRTLHFSPIVSVCNETIQAWNRTKKHINTGNELHRSEGCDNDSLDRGQCPSTSRVAFVIAHLVTALGPLHMIASFIVVIYLKVWQVYVNITKNPQPTKWNQTPEHVYQLFLKY